MNETQDKAFERRLKEGYELSQNDVVGNLDARIDALESQNQALQDRIDKLSDCLQAILDDTAYAVGEEPYETADRLLSPTQETDPIRCQSRCDQYPNCQHDWRSWHTRPTQETDPE